jgi:hypothetical protein
MYYGTHPDTMHEAVVAEAAQLRRESGRRQRDRQSLRPRHWFAALFIH